MIQGARPREYDGFLLSTCSQSKVSLLSAAVAQANYATGAVGKPMSCRIFPIAYIQKEHYHCSNWIQLLETFDLKLMSERGRMRSHVKWLLSFLSRSKIPLILAFSIPLRVPWRSKDTFSVITTSMRKVQALSSKAKECLLFLQRTKPFCFLLKIGSVYWQ